MNVRINDRLRGQIRECIAKVYEHRSHVKDYDGWTEVFVSQGENGYKLHQDDWLYFFGK